MTQTHIQPLSHGGEFLDAATETAFRTERLPEWIRYIRRVFLAAFALNLLFYLNDWKFHGTSHFTTAFLARSAIVLASLAAFAVVRRVRDFRGLERLCAAWCLAVIPPCAVLVSPGTDVALFVIFILPVIFYLALPLSFRRSLTFGLVCSAATMGAHLGNSAPPESWIGLILAMLTDNVVLLLVLTRSNRLQRLEWAARLAEERANGHLSEHRRTLQTLLQAVPVPLVILKRGDGSLIQANEAARAYFGSEAFIAPQAFRDRLAPGALETLAGRLRDGGPVVEMESRIGLADGNSRDVLLAAATATVMDSETLLMTVVDMTSRKEMEAHLLLLANTDPLTGLANRARFFAEAAKEISRARRFGHPLTLVMFDIDHFKQINDTCGHKAGDAALRAFARLCRTLTRAQDVAARLGGEEFALLLPETGQASALALADRIRAAAEDLRLEDLAGPMTVSAGVSELLPGEVLVDAALSRADRAMYAAKRTGRNRTLLYESAPQLPGSSREAGAQD